MASLQIGMNGQNGFARWLRHTPSQSSDWKRVITYLLTATFTTIFKLICTRVFASRTHGGVDFQLLDALLDQLLVIRPQLNEVGGVEREALVIRPGQLPSERQIVDYGLVVWKVLHLILCAPWEDPG
jgi:hypothetical protein